MKNLKTLLTDEHAFAAHLLRYAFAIFFLFVAVKKVRMGYGGFAENLVNPEVPTLISQEISPLLLYIYGYMLPAAEFLVGFMLLIDHEVTKTYLAAGVLYLSFIFGQMYNLNTSKVGTEYFPSMIALVIAFHCYQQLSKKQK